MIKHIEGKTKISSSTPSASEIPMINPKMHTTTSTSDCTDIRVSSLVDQQKYKIRGRKLEDAVYNYLRSLKTVGRGSVGVEEMSDALGLPIGQIKEIVGRLKNRGVTLG